MPQLANSNLSGAEISGCHIITTAMGADGKEASVNLFNAPQFEKPGSPHSVISASDYNQAQCQQFMPGYGQSVSQINSEQEHDGYIEVRYGDGSVTAFYDKTPDTPQKASLQEDRISL